MRLILASASPRRRELLSRLEISFEIVTSQVDERPARPGEDPRDYSLVLADEKAAEVAARMPDALVLGADTVVAIDTHILGKPADGFESAAMLRLLRGRRHEVVTSIVLRAHSGRLSASVTAEVEMRPFGETEMMEYVRTGESLDKAGAYAVQGLGGRLVARVHGCYLAVVGLPLCETVRLLRASEVTVQDETWCSFCPEQRTLMSKSTPGTQVLESCPQSRESEFPRPRPARESRGE